VDLVVDGIPCSTLSQDMLLSCLCGFVTFSGLSDRQSLLRLWLSYFGNSYILKQCFLSRFSVLKWHPKILQWHHKFWKPRYGFAMYWSKTISDKHVFLHVAIATGGCNVLGRRNFWWRSWRSLAQKFYCPRRLIQDKRFTRSSATLVAQAATHKTVVQPSLSTRNRPHLWMAKT